MAYHIKDFTCPAWILECRDAAVEATLGDRVTSGDVVLIRYAGPKGGPGMQEMRYPARYLKSKGLGEACALITDGRFARGGFGLSVGHRSPEVAEGGTIGRVGEGDVIEIDIPHRSIRVAVSDETLTERCPAMKARGVVRPLSQIGG